MTGWNKKIAWRMLDEMGKSLYSKTLRLKYQDPKNIKYAEYQLDKDRANHFLEFMLEISPEKVKETIDRIERESKLEAFK